MGNLFYWLGRSPMVVFTSIGLNVGRNSLAIIYEARLSRNIVRQMLLSGRFSHESVKRVVRVQVKSGHRAVRSNVVDAGALEGAGARPRNVELS